MEEKVSKKIEQFFLGYKNQLYKKGELLIRADDPPHGIFYLNEGQVRQYAISKKGEEIVVNMFKPCAFFPMSWAVNNTPNAYFYEAMVDTQIFRAPKDDVLVFVKANPDVLYDLLSRVYKGTDGLLNRMTYLMSGGAYARLLTEILIQGKRFGESVGTGVILQVSETELAAQSGMTRETVSREIKILKEKGLITFEKGKIFIQSKELLEEALEASE